MIWPRVPRWTPYWVCACRGPPAPAPYSGDLTDDALEEQRRVTGPGYPRPGRYPVRRFVLALLTEEWEHQRYASRDLAVISARLSGS